MSNTWQNRSAGTLNSMTPVLSLAPDTAHYVNQHFSTNAVLSAAAGRGLGATFTLVALDGVNTDMFQLRSTGVTAVPYKPKTSTVQVSSFLRRSSR